MSLHFNTPSCYPTHDVLCSALHFSWWWWWWLFHLFILGITFPVILSYVLLFTFHGGGGGGGCFYFILFILGITFPVIVVAFLSIASRGLLT